ncbi:MAG: c-type cytochrome, partial [Candidatus Kapaibacteriota bacterium]
IEGVKIEEIKTPTNEMLARAKEIYATTCASCHGPNGNGDGIAGKGLNPPPRDFASLTGWKNGRGIVQIYKTLQEGIPGTAMVSYDYLSPKEKIALFYVINGFSNNVPEVTAKDIQELDDTYKVTQNLDIPPTIPIPTAISKISGENKNYTDKVLKISLRLNDEHLEKYILNKRAFANFILRTSTLQQNLLDILLESFPLNGVSPKFILASKQEKEKFIERLASLIKMD